MPKAIIGNSKMPRGVKLAIPLDRCSNFEFAMDANRSPLNLNGSLRNSQLLIRYDVTTLAELFTYVKTTVGSFELARPLPTRVNDRQGTKLANKMTLSDAILRALSTYTRHALILRKTEVVQLHISIHRWQHGLRGYPIPFATHTFIFQSQF